MGVPVGPAVDEGHGGQGPAAAGEGDGRGEQRDCDSCCGPDFPLDKPAALGVPVSHIVDEGHSDQCEQGLEAAWEGGDRGEQGGGLGSLAGKFLSVFVVTLLSDSFSAQLFWSSCSPSSPLFSRWWW